MIALQDFGSTWDTLEPYIKQFGWAPPDYADKQVPLGPVGLPPGPPPWVSPVGLPRVGLPLGLPLGLMYPWYGEQFGPMPPADADTKARAFPSGL